MGLGLRDWGYIGVEGVGVAVGVVIGVWVEGMGLGLGASGFRRCDQG